MTSPIAPDLVAPPAMPVRLAAGVWRRLLKRPLAVLGLVIIAIVVAGAILAPWLTGYDPNEQFFDGLTLEGAPLPPNATYLARHRPARPRPADPHPLRRAHLADHRHRRQRRRAADRHAGRRHRRLFPRLDRRRADALHRPDDGVPGAAARHLPGGDVPAQPVDRRHGDRAGELGADRRASSTPRRARSPSASSSTPSAPSAPSAARILFRHILPHLLPTIIVWGTLGISTTVLLEATLAYLGIGVQPPTASWGNIIFENQTYFQAAPWLVFIPGRRDPGCWRSPSTWSATRCATSSTRRRGGAA